MTETTSINRMVLERRVYAPAVVRQPGLATLLAQAVVGSFFGNVVLVIARVLLIFDPYNGFFYLSFPVLMAWALVTGVPAGLFIWAGSKLARGPLVTINRSLVSVLITALACFFLWLFGLEKDTSATVQRWAVPVILVPGVMMGLVTGSRLRLGRELVRGGDASATALKILAGFTGLILRVSVVLLFLASLIVLISELQLHYRPEEYAQSELLPPVLLSGHLGLSVVVLFVRMRFSVLALLTAIALSPPVASLWKWAQMDAAGHYVIISYFALWALFLLARWRQTPVAFSFLKEELRYYLID